MATGAETGEVQDDLGDAEDLDRLGQRARSCRSGRRSRPAAGPGRGRWAGRRRPTTATSACRSSATVLVAVHAGGDRARPRPDEAGPGQRQLAAVEPPLDRPDGRVRVGGRRPPAARGVPPGTARAARSRARTRRPAVRASMPFSMPRRWWSRNRTSSCRSSRFGPGGALPGQPWTQLPTRVRVGARAPFLHPERRVHVAVHPAADRVDRDLDRVVVRGQRPLPPVRPVGLVAQPREQPRRRDFEPGAPLVQPAGAAEGRVRRHGIHRDLAHRVLRQLAGRDAAAAVVDVVDVPVVRAHARDDRAKMGRTQLGDLDRGEGAVADAPHRDRAARPGLDGGPLDRVVPVARLVGGVLVEGDARRRTRSRGRPPGNRHSRAPRASGRGRCPCRGASCPCRTGSSRR